MKRIAALAANIAPKFILPMIALMMLAMAIPLPETQTGKLLDKLLLFISLAAILIIGFIIGAYYGSEFNSRK